MNNMIDFPAIPDTPPMTGASGVWLCSGIPWDREYKNVRLFNNKAEAVTFIKSRAVYSSQTYVPIRNMKVRFNSTADLINININYIMFQNNYKTTEYFMGFITEVNWLSANSCEITFEWDVFQTWFYGCSVQRCFVVREHVNDDTIGAHTVEENIDFGQLKVYSYNQPSYLTDGYKIMVLSAEDWEGNPSDPTFIPASGVIYDNVYEGLIRRVFDGTEEGAQECSTWIETMVKAGHSDSIALIQMSPTICVSGLTYPYLQARPNNLDGYTPRNNKLFVYPYVRLRASNNLGNTHDYRYEFSSEGNAISFDVEGISTTQPALRIVPKNYNGAQYNNEESLTYNNMPQCAWTSNSFYSWFAQNRNSVALGAVGGAMTMVAGAGIAAGLSAVPISALAGASMIYSGGQKLMNLIGSVEDKRQVPDTVQGQVLNDNINFAKDLVMPCFYTMGIRREYAEIIDGYFDIVGYKVNSLKIPNIRGRAAWNYVETDHAVVNGNVARNFIEIMENALNRGITFWHTNDIGNYSLANGIV